MTQEESEAQEKVTRYMRDKEYEWETGMPAISQWMAPADQPRYPKPKPDPAA